MKKTKSTTFNSDIYIGFTLVQTLLIISFGLDF